MERKVGVVYEKTNKYIISKINLDISRMSSYDKFSMRGVAINRLIIVLKKIQNFMFIIEASGAYQLLIRALYNPNIL
ncbi:hypothetical protein HOK00_07960 [bacterium]|jgi:hypothetical protein|nr:hypothetical protein [bacterium]